MSSVGEDVFGQSVTFSTIIENSGARGEGIPSPETNADKKLARYSTISAVYLK